MSEKTMAATKAAMIQAQINVASLMPRKINEVEKKVKQSCADLDFAELAIYSYPRGGTLIKGPSIRMAEMLARSMGNINYGYTEVTRERGKSVLEAFAIDLEANISTTRIFEVAHVRETKSGTIKLTSNRDIDECVASWAQRRVRSCILQLVPGTLINKTIKACEYVLLKGGTSNIEKMIDAFKSHGVTREQIEERYGALPNIKDDSVIELRSIYNGIANEGRDAAEYFKIPERITNLAKVSDTPPQKTAEASAEPPAETNPGYKPYHRKPAAKAAEVVKKEIVSKSDDSDFVF